VESVIEEYKTWLEEGEKQKEFEKLISFQNKKILLDKEKIYQISGVEAKEDGLHVYLHSMYLNSYQVVFKNLEEIEKRIQHAS